MRNLIAEFCRDYLQWVEEGALWHPSFYRCHGLCVNFTFWLLEQKLLTECTQVLSDELVKEGLDRSLPFNKDMIHFKEEVDHNRCFKNEKRLAWVKAHAHPPHQCTHDPEPQGNAQVCVICNHHIEV